MLVRRFVKLSAACALSLGSLDARAVDPFEIQVYDGTANAPGAAGSELHLNRRSGQTHATLEPSLGLTSFWEAGAYLQGAIRDGGGPEWAGAKLRSKLVTPPDWDAHWRLGVNFELSLIPEAYDRDRWASEARPILAWHDAHWLFAFNPIVSTALAGPDAARGPAFEPAVKAWREVGPVALGFEYYAGLGPIASPLPVRDQEHYVYEVIDLLGVQSLEWNLGIGEGLTPASDAVVFKAIVGYTFEP